MGNKITKAVRSDKAEFRTGKTGPQPVPMSDIRGLRLLTLTLYPLTEKARRLITRRYNYSLNAPFSFAKLTVVIVYRSSLT